MIKDFEEFYSLYKTRLEQIMGEALPSAMELVTNPQAVDIRKKRLEEMTQKINLEFTENNVEKFAMLQASSLVLGYTSNISSVKNLLTYINPELPAEIISEILRLVDTNIKQYQTRHETT